MKRNIKKQKKLLEVSRSFFCFLMYYLLEIEVSVILNICLFVKVVEEHASIATADRLECLLLALGVELTSALVNRKKFDNVNTLVALDGCAYLAGLHLGNY